MSRWLVAFGTTAASSMILLAAIAWMSAIAILLVGIVFGLINFFVPSWTPPFGAISGPEFVMFYLRRTADQFSQLFMHSGSMVMVGWACLVGVVGVTIVRVLGLCAGRLVAPRVASNRRAEVTKQELSHYCRPSIVIRHHVLGGVIGYFLFVAAHLQGRAHWAEAFFSTLSVGWIVWPAIGLFVVSMATGFQSRTTLGKLVMIASRTCLCGYPLSATGTCPECGTRFEESSKVVV
jgi:hypothetical protein